MFHVVTRPIIESFLVSGPHSCLIVVTSNFLPTSSFHFFTQHCLPSCSHSFIPSLQFYNVLYKQQKSSALQSSQSRKSSSFTLQSFRFPFRHDEALLKHSSSRGCSLARIGRSQCTHSCSIQSHRLRSCAHISRCLCCFDRHLNIRRAFFLICELSNHDVIRHCISCIVHELIDYSRSSPGLHHCSRLYLDFDVLQGSNRRPERLNHRFDQPKHDHRSNH